MEGKRDITFDHSLLHMKVFCKPFLAKLCEKISRSILTDISMDFEVSPQTMQFQNKIRQITADSF